MSIDPTRIKMGTDPRTQRMSGVTIHGNVPFDVPFISEIAHNLWQGGCENGLLLPAHFAHLVSLYPWESYKVAHQLKSALLVWMLDSTDQDMAQVDEIAAWVNTCRKTGPVLVMCQAGLNRSTLVTARALMLNGATADDAVTLIRKKRSPACLCNPAFGEWLGVQPRGQRHFRDECTRLYTRRGRVAHLMPPTSSIVSNGSTLCPVTPKWPDEWLGTGSQAEHERAASLPLCQPCAARASGEDAYRNEPSQFRQEPA